uniref:Uncharacterized protein n=1 Tax=Moniliophthora roreri TaxID=221103 RepID=A0A0W0F4U9_MONRR
MAINEEGETSDEAEDSEMESQMDNLDQSSQTSHVEMLDATPLIFIIIPSFTEVTMAKSLPILIALTNPLLEMTGLHQLLNLNHLEKKIQSLKKKQT